LRTAVEKLVQSLLLNGGQRTGITSQKAIGRVSSLTSADSYAGTISAEIVFGMPD
jgi:hypothetical protein